MWRPLVSLLMVAACSSSSTPSGEIAVRDLQLRIAPAGATTAAVYFTVRNSRTSDDTLRSIASSAGTMSLHESISRNGVMQMLPLTTVVVPSGDELRFSVGALHGMLEQFTRPLTVGDTVSFIFDFARSGVVRLTTTTLPVAGVE